MAGLDRKRPRNGVTRMALAADLLPLPARYGARIAARDRLEHVLTAAADLVAPRVMERNPAAVHRFRVTTRRLRGALRDFKPALDDTISGHPRRRLGDIADLAGAVRDCDVQVAWLRAEHRGLAAPGRTAAAEIAARLDAERRRALEPLRQAVVDRLPKIAAKLARALRYYHLDGDLDAPEREPTMASLVSRAAIDHCREAREALEAVGPRGSGPAMHHARIRLKRLRDLLEVIEHAAPETRRPIDALGTLQDSAGALHDLQVLRRRIAVCRPARGRSNGDARLLVFLDRRITVATRAARRAFRRPTTTRLLDRIERIAGELNR